MNNNGRVASSLALAQLREMERIHASFPFGTEISERVLERCRLLFSSATTVAGGYSGRPDDRNIYSALGDASAAYTEFGRMDSISWIEHHELIRLRLSQLLYPLKKGNYKMSEAQIREWRYGVFLFAKGFAKKLNRRRKSPENFQRQAQICIDAIHTLITVLRDNSEDTLFREDYSFLITLCQKATLLPRSFFCSEKLEFGTDTPVDAGASATIYRGFLGAAEVAVKSFRLYYRTINQVKKRFIREALILHLVRHPNILRFTSIVDEQFKIYIITPWHTHGHIMKYIAAVEGVHLKELMEQVADGLHFLFQYGIVHGDLKGSNILIGDNGTAMIADLGLSFIQETTVVEPSHAVEDPFAVAILRRQCAEAISTGRLSVTPRSISTLAATVLSAASSSGGGTFRWMAPERLVPSAYGLPTAKATTQSDVYSFGMLMLEVFSGEPPWGSARNECSIALNVVTNLRPSRPSSMPDDLWEIVQECWAHSPTGRPTIQEVYNRLACIA